MEEDKSSSPRLTETPSSSCSCQMKGDICGWINFPAPWLQDDCRLIGLDRSDLQYQPLTLSGRAWIEDRNDFNFVQAHSRPPKSRYAHVMTSTYNHAYGSFVPRIPISRPDMPAYPGHQPSLDPVTRWPPQSLHRSSYIDPRYLQQQLYLGCSPTDPLCPTDLPCPINKTKEEYLNSIVIPKRER